MVASVFKSFFFFPESLKTKTGIRRTHYCDVKCFVQSTLICIFTHSQLTNTWVTTETQCEAAAESGASQNESPSAAYKLWYVPLSFKTEAGEKTSSSYGRSLKFMDVEMLRVSKFLGGKKDESCESSENWKRTSLMTVSVLVRSLSGTPFIS